MATLTIRPSFKTSAMRLAAILDSRHGSISRSTTMRSMSAVVAVGARRGTVSGTRLTTTSSPPKAIMTLRVNCATASASAATGPNALMSSAMGAAISAMASVLSLISSSCRTSRAL